MKKVLIAIAIVIGAAMLLILPGIGVKNSAISKENLILETKESITVQTNARNNKLDGLIKSIKSYQTYEQAIINKINEAETSFAEGDYEGAKTIVTDLVKLYPELQSAEHYSQYNTELITCENRIAAYRESYNGYVRDYKTFVRQFPNSTYLSIFGYTAIDFEYISYTADDNNVPTFGD